VSQVGRCWLGPVFWGDLCGVWITKGTEGREGRERVSCVSRILASSVVQAAFNEHHCTVKYRDGIQAAVGEPKQLGAVGLARAFRGELC
jgi:hypothetical protein